LRRTSATATWASRSRTWVAARWSDTRCGARTCSWGPCSQTHRPTAQSWRCYRGTECFSWEGRLHI
jgi:hypothetical protein